MEIFEKNPARLQFVFPLSQGPGTAIFKLDEKFAISAWSFTIKLLGKVAMKGLRKLPHQESDRRVGYFIWKGVDAFETLGQDRHVESKMRFESCGE
jgi:hypothetical protein